MTRAAFAFVLAHAEFFIAGLWFGLTLWVTLSIWGLEPVAFPATDEAVNRSAALLLRKTGTPTQQLPFADPEDLAHMRLWLSVGERALPAYPPVTIYAYGLLSYLGKFGYFLIAMFPATAAAAFGSGVARLLPKDRRWLGLLAPALGFPGFYWLVRPWMNISVMLGCLCWALFYWAHWRSRGGTLWLAAALFSVGAAVAVRPDYAAHWLSAALVFSLAAAPGQWRRVTAYTLAAGACAVGVNLILNKILTGHAFRAVYQLVVEREYGGDGGQGPLQILGLLVFPMGVPGFAEVGAHLNRYWIQLGPLAVLAAAQLALIPLWWSQTRAGRILYELGVLLVVVALCSHVHAALFGASVGVGNVSHSIPRYWSTIYLFAALPPLLFLGRTRFRLLYFAGAALACAVCWLGLRENFVNQPISFAFIEHYVSRNTNWLDVAARVIPPDAIVYSEKADRILWSRWHLGIIDAPRPTVASIRRALEAGLPVYVLETKRTHATKRLRRALGAARLRIVEANRRQHLYRVEAPEKSRSWRRH